LRPERIWPEQQSSSRSALFLRWSRHHGGYITHE